MGGSSSCTTPDHEATPKARSPSTMLDVKLVVYKLNIVSPSQIGSSFINSMGCNMAGAYHSAVAIGRCEYAYHGHGMAGMTGVYTTQPEHDPNYTFYQSIPMGRVDEKHAQQMMDAITQDWMGCHYNTFSRNCNHFASDLCQRLIKVKPPSWVNNTADTLCKVYGEQDDITMTLDPGRLGVTIDRSSGLITNVYAGPLAEKGLQAGYTFRRIDGEPYTKELLKTKSAGSQPFVVSFKPGLLLKRGDRVRVTEEFKSTNINAVRISQGRTGVVLKISTETGSAQVHFNHLDTVQWVPKCSFECLRKESVFKPGEKVVAVKPVQSSNLQNEKNHDIPVGTTAKVLWVSGKHGGACLQFEGIFRPQRISKSALHNLCHDVVHSGQLKTDKEF